MQITEAQLAAAVDLLRSMGARRPVTLHPAPMIQGLARPTGFASPGPEPQALPGHESVRHALVC